MHLTAQQLYETLIEQNITSHQGQTIMTFMDISVTITDHAHSAP
jgi:hypothetical protein